ncbi:RNA-directed DNA polymerase, eukaryota, reverse transcriptase zinc-binding domain protein, partial [Tanacetum coccineum]
EEDRRNVTYDNKGASTPYAESHIASSRLDVICKRVFRHWPWCILGDFNNALNIEDVSAGSSFMDISMREFKECIEEIELINVPRSGLQFTWNQKPQHNLQR